jgi:predicted helicase
MERLEDMASHALSDDVLREKYNLADNGDWLLPEARRRIRSLGSRWRSLVITCAYKPVDERWCCFDEAAMDRPRRELKDHVGGKENLCLLTVRQMQDNVPYTHVEIVSTVAVDRVFACSRGAATVIPLYCYDTSSEGLAQRSTSRDRHANFGASVLGTMTARLKLKVVPDGRGDPVHGTIGPEDILAYVYAILYSPSYRIRYGGFLKSDFPRIPIPRLSDTCVQLLRLGQQLIDLHLLQSQSLDDPISSFCGKGDHAVTKVKYDADSARVSINPTQYFGSVMPDVWSYQVGGYQVLQKWLKDRGPKGGQAGRVLSLDDILHYRKVVTAIAKTIELQAEIDRVIAAAGGFPAAFQ